MALVDGKLLLTSLGGIARVNPADGTGHWEHLVPGCRGPVIGHERGVLAVCGHGVIALGRNESARPVGGPVDRWARLVPGADRPYVFTTTGPPGPV